MQQFQPLSEEEFLSLSMKGLNILQQNERWRTAYGTPVT
jgi:hypothetical protein